jgi:putative thioredoxin
LNNPDNGHRLAPTLERIAQEPNSNFVLAKVNVDNNPQLSVQYGVQGIPAVKAFVEGKAVDGFVGAQPEPMVRQFIQRVLSQAPARAATAKPSMQVPRDPQARLDMAKDLLRNGDGCRAQKVLRDFPPLLQSVEASALLPLAKFICEVNQQYQTQFA